MPTQEQARQWLDRWDRQQEVYIPGREERFAVIADVVRAAAGRPDPLVVDLGAGPGSLSVRILDRIPQAEVVALDADPLLLGLAGAAYGDRAGLRIVGHDLRGSGWEAALDLPRPADAMVSTTALHWLTGEELAALYRSCADLLRPGGVLVNGDHLQVGPDQPRLGALVRAVDAGTTERATHPASSSPSGAEDWGQWWDAVGAAPELADLVGARGARPIEHTVPDEPTAGEHERLLRAAGFAEVGTVWQQGEDRVLVAVR